MTPCLYVKTRFLIEVKALERLELALRKKKLGKEISNFWKILYPRFLGPFRRTKKSDQEHFWFILRFTRKFIFFIRPFLVLPSKMLPAVGAFKAVKRCDP